MLEFFYAFCEHIEFAFCVGKFQFFIGTFIKLWLELFFANLFYLLFDVVRWFVGFASSQSDRSFKKKMKPCRNQTRRECLQETYVSLRNNSKSFWINSVFAVPWVLNSSLKSVSELFLVSLSPRLKKSLRLAKDRLLLTTTDEFELAELRIAHEKILFILFCLCLLAKRLQIKIIFTKSCRVKSCPTFWVDNFSNIVKFKF